MFYSTSRDDKCWKISKISTPSWTVVIVSNAEEIRFWTITSKSFTPARNLKNKTSVLNYHVPEKTHNAQSKIEQTTLYNLWKNDHEGVLSSMMNIIFKVSPKYELNKATTKATLFLLQWVFLFIQFHEHNNIDNSKNIQQTSHCHYSGPQLFSVSFKAICFHLPVIIIMPCSCLVKKQKYLKVILWLTLLTEVLLISPQYLQDNKPFFWQF